MTSTTGGLTPIFNVCAAPIQPFNVGTTWIVPAETTVVEMAFVPMPATVLPDIFAEPEAKLMVHKFGTVHA